MLCTRPGPRLRHRQLPGRAGAGFPHVAAVTVPERYPSAPPPQSPSAFPGPSESGHRGRIARTRAYVPPWPRRTGSAALRSSRPYRRRRRRRRQHNHSAASRRGLVSPWLRAGSRAGRPPQLLPRCRLRVLPPQLLGEGGGRCLRRAASSPPPPRLPPRRRHPLPPPPLRLLLLAVPAAVRRARRWPVGRATWIT